MQRLTAQIPSVDILRTEVAGLSAEVETMRTKLAGMATLEAEVARLRDLTSISADRTVFSVTTQSAKSAGKARATYVVVASMFIVALRQAFTGTRQMKQDWFLSLKWSPKPHQKLRNHTPAFLHIFSASVHGIQMTAHCLASLTLGRKAKS